ncbi:MAG TPA: BON domain-containing protein [Flavipsychrobacter sp.]|nr:BON domain-containing protein [Flavipsychrobacter sp.]
MRRNKDHSDRAYMQSRDSNLRNSRLDRGIGNEGRGWDSAHRQRPDGRRNADDEGYDNYDAEFNNPFNNRATENDWWPSGQQNDMDRYRGSEFPERDQQSRNGNWREYRRQGGPWYDRDRMNERRDWSDYQDQAGSWNDRGSWDARNNWNREQGNQWNDNSRWYPEDEWQNMQDRDTWNSSFQSKGRGEGYGMNEHYDRSRRNSYGQGSASHYSDGMQNKGLHKGKGPKGYQRSDERILDDVNDRLTDDDSVDAGNIEVSVNGAEVVLAGTVSSKNEKRRAEDIAESVSGVRNVENRLRVSQENEQKKSAQDTDSNTRQSANGQSHAVAGSRNKK